jgi:hypothetical protein
MYRSGVDDGIHCFVLQVMPALQNPSLVASQLLLIAGQRLWQIVMNSPDMRNKMSHLSPSLSTWLHSLVSCDCCIH